MASVGQVARDITDSRKGTKTGYPQGGARFDWAMVGLSALFLAGLWVDGWAHFHDKVDDSFFTPWHFIFYGSFGLLALFLGYNQVRNVNRGHAFSKALPRGYQLSLIGVAVFATSGAIDMVWHMLFGIEGGTEALMSPSHIGLAIGMGFVFSGTVIATWIQAKQREDLRGWLNGWRLFGPMILGMTMLITIAWFFTSYANPSVTPYIAMGSRSDQIQDFGVTSILFSAAILSGFALPMLRRWRLPFGTFTVIFGISTAMLTVLNDFYLLIPGAIIAGLLVDILVNRLRPSQGAAWRLLIVAFCVPFIYYAMYFLTMYLIDTLIWSVHVWTGAMFISGVMGLALALLTIISADEKLKAADNQ